LVLSPERFFRSRSFLNTWTNSVIWHLVICPSEFGETVETNIENLTGECANLTGEPENLMEVSAPDSLSDSKRESVYYLSRSCHLIPMI